MRIAEKLAYGKYDNKKIKVVWARGKNTIQQMVANILELDTLKRRKAGGTTTGWNREMKEATDTRNNTDMGDTP